MLKIFKNCKKIQEKLLNNNMNALQIEDHNLFQDILALSKKLKIE